MVRLYLLACALKARLSKGISHPVGVCDARVMRCDPLLASSRRDGAPFRSKAPGLNPRSTPRSTGNGERKPTWATLRVSPPQQTLDTSQCEQVRRCSMSRSRWSRALGRGTYGGCEVGQYGQGLLRSLHRQVRRLLARRAASPNPDGRSATRPTPHRCTAFTARRRDTLECTCCSEGGSVLSGERVFQFG
jgi:hypothetical protein